MSRTSVLLAVLTHDPLTTDELYDRVGYATLTRVGLVPYRAFRAELTRLAAAGVVESEPGEDGATLWRRAAPPPDDVPT